MMKYDERSQPLKRFLKMTTTAAQTSTTIIARNKMSRSIAIAYISLAGKFIEIDPPVRFNGFDSEPAGLICRAVIIHANRDSSHLPAGVIPSNKLPYPRTSFFGAASSIFICAASRSDCATARTSYAVARTKCAVARLIRAVARMNYAVAQFVRAVARISYTVAQFVRHEAILAHSAPSRLNTNNTTTTVKNKNL